MGCLVPGVKTDFHGALVICVGHGTCSKVCGEVAPGAMRPHHCSVRAAPGCCTTPFASRCIPARRQRPRGASSAFGRAWDAGAVCRVVGGAGSRAGSWSRDSTEAGRWGAVQPRAKWERQEACGHFHQRGDSYPEGPRGPATCPPEQGSVQALRAGAHSLLEGKGHRPSEPAMVCLRACT